MSIPAASSICYNKCLTVYSTEKSALRSKSTPHAEHLVVSSFVYSPWEDEELGSQTPSGRE